MRCLKLYTTTILLILNSSTPSVNQATNLTIWPPWVSVLSPTQFFERNFNTGFILCYWGTCEWRCYRLCWDVLGGPQILTRIWERRTCCYIYCYGWFEDTTCHSFISSALYKNTRNHSWWPRDKWCNHWRLGVPWPCQSFYDLNLLFHQWFFQLARRSKQEAKETTMRIWFVCLTVYDFSLEKTSDSYMTWKHSNFFSLLFDHTILMMYYLWL